MGRKAYGNSVYSLGLGSWLQLFVPDGGGWISKQTPRQDLMCQQRDWEIRLLLKV